MEQEVPYGQIGSIQPAGRSCSTHLNPPISYHKENAMTTNKPKQTREELLDKLAHGNIISQEPIQGSLHYDGEGHGKYEEERMILTKAATHGLEAGKKVAGFPKMPGSDGITDWHVGDEPSGIAWVVLRPLNSKLAEAAKKIFDIDIDADHKGGVKIWIREFDQSYKRNVAYAEAFAGYLKSEGYDAIAGFMLDGDEKQTDR